MAINCRKLKKSQICGSREQCLHKNIFAAELWKKMKEKHCLSLDDM